MQTCLCVIFIIIAVTQMVTCKQFRGIKDTRCICESKRNVLEVQTDDGLTFVEQHLCLLNVISHSEHVTREVADCCCRASHEPKMVSSNMFYSYTPTNGCKVVPCAAM